MELIVFVSRQHLLLIISPYLYKNKGKHVIIFIEINAKTRYFRFRILLYSFTAFLCLTQDSIPYLLRNICKI